MYTKSIVKNSWALFACIIATPIFAATFYCDPVHGSMSGDGSQSNPWSTLSDVLDNGLIESQEPVDKPYSAGEPLQTLNPGAPIKAGDTIMLMSGYHGDIDIVAYYNSDMIYLEAAQNETPVLGKFHVVGGRNWTLRGVTISQEPYGTPDGNLTLVDLASSSHQGPVSNVSIEDCHIYSVDDITDWIVEDWRAYASEGIVVDGPNCEIRNNLVRNVSFGIKTMENSDHATVASNTVRNFSGDGMRCVDSDYSVYEYNLIADCYDIGENHDDGFQAYTTGPNEVIDSVIVRGNIIIEFTDQNRPYVGPLQGIYGGKGYYDNWVIENNVVAVDQWQAIALTAARNCISRNNTVIDLDPDSDTQRPWIRFRDTDHFGQQGSGNTIINNISRHIRVDPGTDTVSNNVEITQSDYASYFVDWENFDLRLLRNSPAVDVGTSTDAASIDLLGNARPYGSTHDLGAYEFVESLFEFTGLASPYPSSQDGAGGHGSSVAISGNELSATLTGNAWKCYDISYTVTSNTVLQISVDSTDVGEIIGVSLDNDNDPFNSMRSFLLGGSSVDGSNHADWSWTITPSYQEASGQDTYVIPVGEYFTGPVTKLGLIADDDANGSTTVTFSKIELKESESLTGDENGAMSLIDFLTYAPSAYSSGQDGAGNLTIEGDGHHLHLTGNRWQKIDYSHTVTTSTLIDFEVEANNEGELIGIGFDDDNDFSTQPYSIFKIGGSDRSPSQWLDFASDYYSYYQPGGVDRIVIPVGEYYTGEMNQLCFIADDDRNADANVTFSDVRVYEGVLVDFDNFTIDAYSDQDGANNQPTSASIGSGGLAIELNGNAWKRIALPCNVTSDTIIEVELSLFADDSSEIVAIGFEDDNDHENDLRLFQLAGEDVWNNAIQDHNNYPGGNQNYVIPVGDYYTGAMSHLVVVGADDATAGADVRFKNIRIHESR